jgi:hypothetical protein
MGEFEKANPSRGGDAKPGILGPTSGSSGRRNEPQALPALPISDPKTDLPVRVDPLSMPGGFGTPLNL